MDYNISSLKVEMHNLHHLESHLEHIIGKNILTRCSVVFDTELLRLSVSMYSVHRKYGAAIIARIMQFPSCCGVGLLSSHKCYDNELPAINVIDALFNWSESLCSRNGYTESLYITALNQTNQIQVLKKRDWNDGHSFVNRNSTLKCTYWHKELPKWGE